MKKLWILGYLAIVIVALAVVAWKTVDVDPFFHYHAPNTDAYFYRLNNERSQNDGISRHFDYEGIITGTSMTQNFKTSEAGDLFDMKFVKVPFSGATFNEINLNLSVAARNNPDLKVIVRGLDMVKFFDEKDSLRGDLGTRPTYLYDDNLFNDVEYVFNRDVVFSRVYPMTKENDKEGFKGGITSFDQYSNWMKGKKFGQKILYPDGWKDEKQASPKALKETEIETIRGNIRQNVAALAKEYPQITFYYFFTPYSAGWWHTKLVRGELDKQIEAERIVIEEMLQCDNIQLYSFNCLFDITTDLNNYKDTTHYGEWINSLMLRYMHDGKCRLTWDNYLDYLEQEREFYSEFDYKQLTQQEDYEEDTYAAALVNQEITGTEPYQVFENMDLMELSGAEMEEDQYNGQKGLVCTGTLARPSGSDITVSDYLRDTGFVGAKIQLPDLTAYKYLVFRGKKIKDRGQLTVRLYDENGKELAALDKEYGKLDNKWHQYIINTSKIKCPCTLILNGGYIDSTGSEASKYAFSDMTLY